MKKVFFSIVVALLFLSPVKSVAQDFYWGFYGSGTNFWIVPIRAVGSLAVPFGGSGECGYDYEWLQVEDSQGKIDVENGNYFGFKARDFFSHLECGLNIGYMPSGFPLGAYFRAGYDLRQFKMQPDRSIVDGMEKYRVNSCEVGVGLRITPFVGMLEYDGWSPFFEVLETYHKPFKAQAPYDCDIEQFGSGFSSTLRLGVRLYDDYNEGSLTFSLSFMLPHYDYFNRDFTSSAGLKPYADITSKNYGISLTATAEF